MAFRWRLHLGQAASSGALDSGGRAMPGRYARPVTSDTGGMPRPSSSDLDRIRSNVEEERRAAKTYRALADQVDGRARHVLLELAAGEERHANQWAAILERYGLDAPGDVGHPWRARLLVWIARRFGIVGVVPLLERHEGSEMASYTDDEHAPEGIVDEERAHAELVSSLAPAWRTTTAGTLRAGVFGVSDGVVSNLALVMGVFGAGARPEAVVTAGVAGLVAGALSMAAGEYVSVASQREVLIASLTDMEPDDQGANPRRAALASFVMFALGAFIPLAPFLMAAGLVPAVASLFLTGFALLGVGAGLSLLTLQPAWRPALRQLALGWGAAALTYLVGVLIGGGSPPA